MTFSSAIGLICECNPLHSGHVTLIQHLKQHHRPIVCAMSGPFVQRGSAAILDKWTRAEGLIRHGADLVLEIPQRFVLQSADYFAEGGIQTLSLIPSIRAIGFGVEEPLQIRESEAFSFALSDPEQQKQIRMQIRSGSSFRQALSDLPGAPTRPNQILANAYLRSMRRHHLNWETIVLSRPEASPEAPSATQLRSAIVSILKQNPSFSERVRAFTEMESFRGLVDPECVAEHARIAETEKLLHFLQLASLLHPLDFSLSPSFETGMDERIKSALSSAHSLEEGIQAASNKRQSRARYRRLILSTVLGITRNDLYLQEAIRPLAFNQNGAALLRETTVPIIQKAASQPLSESASRSFSIDQKAERLYEQLTGSGNLDRLHAFFIPD